MHRNPCTNLYPIGSCSRELLIWTDLLSPFSPATSGRNLMKLSKGKCSVLSLDGVIPHTRTGWGPTCESTVSSWSFPSTKKGSDVLKWIQQHATKVSRGWKLKYRLRAESVQPEDEYGQISLLSANTWRVTVEKNRGSRSSEMHAKRMKVNTHKVPQKKFWLDTWQTSLLREWSNWIKLPRKAKESPPAELSKNGQDMAQHGFEVGLVCQVGLNSRAHFHLSYIILML